MGGRGAVAHRGRRGRRVAISKSKSKIKFQNQNQIWFLKLEIKIKIQIELVPAPRSHTAQADDLDPGTWTTINLVDHCRAIGRKGGQARSEAKARAARENARKPRPKARDRPQLRRIEGSRGRIRAARRAPRFLKVPPFGAVL